MEGQFVMKKFLIIICAVALLITGCGQTQQAPAPQKTSVKAMKVLQQPIKVTYGFPGQVQGVDEVQVRSKVNGNVVGKKVV